jgi:hypothetical protein
MAPDSDHLLNPKSKRRGTLGCLLTFGCIAIPFVLFFNGITWLWSSPEGEFLVVAFCVLIVLLSVWEIRKSAAERHDLDAAIRQIKVSDNRFDYFIGDEDYTPDNPKERLYRKMFHFPLFEVYENSCAKCGDDKNSLEIDHFIFNKSEGGCFIMRRADGSLVNNAVPLCETWRKINSVNSYRDLYSKEELLYLFQKNLVMTKKLNETKILTPEGHVIEQTELVN